MSMAWGTGSQLGTDSGNAGFTMRYEVSGQFATALFCALFCRLVDATCFETDNPASACRYPAGDAWCGRNGGGALYAYKDGCVDEQGPAEAPVTTRPPAPLTPWKPVAVWDCDRARTPVEHLICAAPQVRAQDLTMGALYSELQARGLAPEQMQKTWLKKQREACDTVDCLRAVYAERISHFEALLATGAAPEDPAAPSAYSQPKRTASANTSPPVPARPASGDLEDASATTAVALKPVVSEPRSFPESAIPQLPPPEVYSPVTTGEPSASPKSEANVDWITVLAVGLAMALGLFAWLRRSRSGATQRPYGRLLAAVWHRGTQGQAHAGEELPRLDVETLARLGRLRHPGESVAAVLSRALAALEAAPPERAGAVTPQRLDTLEARLERLEGRTGAG